MKRTKYGYTGDAHTPGSTPPNMDNPITRLQPPNEGEELSLISGEVPLMVIFSTEHQMSDSAIEMMLSQWKAACEGLKNPPQLVVMTCGKVDVVKAESDS